MLGLNQGLLANLLLVGVAGAMFFLLSRSQNKKRKQEEAMRKNLKIGDEITTVGGIIGKVVSLREDNDSAVVETGANKIRIKRWAIAGVNEINKVK
ncbi:MAG: preprotein translocase subunit YajC [Oscillospiraceae bacterium]|jgi:preprotein translocase subunit YajC|nr:preprotein translocase subunit YajC [Oscillospiraceae bacterium]